MSRPILSEYGPDSGVNETKAQPRLAGGVMECKPLPYSPPKGPKGQMQQGPGLHGDNLGNCGTQGKR